LTILRNQAAKQRLAVGHVAGFSPFRPFGWAEEVEVEVLLLCDADEFPAVGEGAAEEVAEVLDGDLTGLAGPGSLLEEAGVEESGSQPGRRRG
jgi:hypothetical protein